MSFSDCARWDKLVFHTTSMHEDSQVLAKREEGVPRRVRLQTSKSQNTGPATIGSGYCQNNRVRLIRSGKEYFQLLLQCIRESKTCIHLQTYIFSDDETGMAVTESLISAAKRNVSVYLIADGYASQSISATHIKYLQQNGIRFRYFEPIFKSKYFYFGRRLHHKVAVFDGYRGLVGGININNRYNDMPGKSAWLDFAVYVEGEVALQLSNRCSTVWEGLGTRTNIPKCGEMKIHPPGILSGTACRMRINDWVRNKNQISRSYLEMFKNAKSDITILSSYFLPGRVFKRNLAEAARRGVQIRVVLAGDSDVKLAKNAERYIYRWLLKNNIEIYEYKPTVLHGKIALYDDKWTTAGSYNVNNISAYASIELNVDVADETFCKSVKSEVDEIIKNHCIQVTEAYFNSHTTLVDKVLQKVSSYIVRLLFYLFTFYFKQKQN